MRSSVCPCRLSTIESRPYFSDLYLFSSLIAPDFLCLFYVSASLYFLYYFSYSFYLYFLFSLFFHHFHLFMVYFRYFLTFQLLFSRILGFLALLLHFKSLGAHHFIHEGLKLNPAPGRQPSKSEKGGSVFLQIDRTWPPLNWDRLLTSFSCIERWC